MKFLFSKRLGIVILIGLILGGFLWTAHRQGEDWVLKILEPAKRASQRFTEIFNAASKALILENETLKNERDQLRLEILKMQEHLQALQQETLDTFGTPGIFARITSFNPAQVEQILWLNQGATQGVQVGDTVIASGALLGRVILVRPNFCQVLLITDLRSTVAVRDVQSRAQGMVVGKRMDLGLDRSHWLTQGEYFEAKEEINPGDLLITSGLDGLFPEGIPVGVAREVKKDKEGLFWQALVEPQVDVKKISGARILLQREKS